MKSVLEGKQPENKEAKYPRLMIAKDGDVVLFEAKKKGTVVHAVSCSPRFEVGEYSDDWEMSSFEPLRGRIILSN